MRKVFIAGLTAGIILLLVSMGLMFLVVKIFPSLAEEYFSPVFRWSSAQTDWLFYAHPFVLSFALKWFWERYKDSFRGSNVVRAFEVALVYGVVAMLPVLWLTYSSIDISLGMVLTWLVYGILQAFIAGLIFSWLNP